MASFLLAECALTSTGRQVLARGRALPRDRPPAPHGPEAAIRPSPHRSRRPRRSSRPALRARPRRTRGSSSSMPSSRTTHFAGVHGVPLGASSATMASRNSSPLTSWGTTAETERSSSPSVAVAVDHVEGGEGVREFPLHERLEVVGVHGVAADLRAELLVELAGVVEGTAAPGEGESAVQVQGGGQGVASLHEDVLIVVTCVWERVVAGEGRVSRRRRRSVQPPPSEGRRAGAHRRGNSTVSSFA